ncbi:hypothetical protein H8M03_10910 [Sphingomonas sabuli]|uniref:Uncharacterized protein n=1 Tax=Sphingomonas sabuli TaxID=2764186 RepID=A0A7G9L1K4_9SPHN|nr:hypothetical protein [Sphingomonas sabuli]QNM82503.1 hypothetical protein H8M03_10910 [Sphingomonas sabuli]
MSDDPYAPQPVARWYMAAAIASLLFMLLGCANYLMIVTADPASLPLDQRTAIEAQPLWAIAASAIAVWVGLAGALLLLLRRKLAQPLLLASLVATVVSFIPLFAVPAVANAITANDIAVAIVVTIIVWTIFWFARHSAQRGWLR